MGDVSSVKAFLIAGVLALASSSTSAAEFQPATWQKLTAQRLPEAFPKIKTAHWSQDISLWVAVVRGDGTNWDIAAKPLCTAMDGYGRPAKASVIITFLDAADLQQNKMTTVAKYTCPDAVVPSTPQSANSGAPAARIKLTEIIGKPQKDVEAVLGKPIEKCSTGKYGLTCDYMAGAARVVYIDKLADWISIERPPLTFAADAIAAYGLVCDPSTAFTRADFIRWDNTCAPVLSATIWAGEKRPDGSRDVQSINIKAKTP